MHTGCAVLRERSAGSCHTPTQLGLCKVQKSKMRVLFGCGIWKREAAAAAATRPRSCEVRVRFPRSCAVWLCSFEGEESSRNE